MAKVQCVLQSNENVSFEDDMNVYLVHVSMPQGGAATRKKETLWFQTHTGVELKVNLKS